VTRYRGEGGAPHVRRHGNVKAGHGSARESVAGTDCAIALVEEDLSCSSLPLPLVCPSPALPLVSPS